MNSVDPLRAKASERSIKLPFHELIKEMHDGLRGNLLSKIFETDHKTVQRWIANENKQLLTRSVGHHEMAVVTYQAWFMIKETHGVDAARVWFLMQNPSLPEEISPEEAIHQKLWKELTQAAMKFCNLNGGDKENNE